MTENTFSNPCLVYVSEFIILVYSVTQGMLKYQIPKSRNFQLSIRTLHCHSKLEI